MISRRRFLETGAAAAALLAWPIRAFPFSQSVLRIPKFNLSLPGLGPGNKNQLGNYIPVLTAVTPTPLPGTDVYEIDVVPFTQRLLPAPNTMKQRLWGYAAPNSTPMYLGGVIVANSGVPVQLRVTNKLPDKHIVPIDFTLIDPVVEAETGMRQDRITIHLHGAFVFWAYDGGPFLWFSNPSNGGFVHGSSFINGPTNGPGVGTAFYNYPNEQSARTLWYHDHAYALTRQNVYAGQSSMYLITDTNPDGEAGLVDNGIIPGKGLTVETGLLGFPLIIQDKTFWDGPSGNDPNYPSVVPAGASVGDLWSPHVYEGAPLANLPLMQLPPEGPPPQPPGTVLNARWETGTATLPDISTVPEFFSDTILVNGAPYPTLNVKPQRYRFRILNASQARFYNLQTYVAETGNPDGYTLVPIGPTSNDNNLDNNGNVLLVPRNAAGPAFIQIANEAGFLPEPALFSKSSTDNHNSNRVIEYKNASTVRADRRRADGADNVLLGDPTIGNVNQYNLLMAPAERADVLIDFRGFEGEEIILYSDAPAPFPGGDTRNDYFVLTNVAGLPAGYNDLTILGGAPSPVSGNGPDTRVLMKFIVSNTTPSGEPDFAQTVTALRDPNKGLPFVFSKTQPTLNITPTVTVQKTLNEDMDEFGRLRQLLGVVPLPAVQTFLDFPTEIATVGEVQEWQIFNLTGDTHPMHFHLVNLKVVKRQQWAFNSDGTPKLPLTPIGPDLPIDDNEKGWKEMVRMNPGEVTTVVMKFDLPKGTPPPNSPRLLASYGINGAEYVWHCHILEHEEHDMMHALVVV